MENNKNNNAPGWLNLSFINGSDVCRLLYGSATKTNTSKFAHKRYGIRGQRFSEEELEKLNGIRKLFIEQLKK